jgi:hypothetical protein
MLGAPLLEELAASEQPAMDTAASKPTRIVNTALLNISVGSKKYERIAMAAAFDSLVQIVFGPRRSTELGSKSPPEEGLSK